MIGITNPVDCCGCNACGDVCARKAITFKTDIEGFWYPEVDAAKCNNCGLCERVCPIVNAEALKKNDFAEPECYAAEHKNMEVVFDSTSGGLFSALADVVYREGGYVGGAVFNDDFSIREYISNNKEDLPRLRSSKYAQSDSIGFYTEVKRLVDAGEKVLVCGGPCQMVALRAFLRRDYENLVIADYICRGINSPKVWRKYLDSFEERYGSPVVYCKAKSKEYGWRNLTQKVILANGKHIYEPKDINKFTKGYLGTNAYCRPSCYACPFKGFPLTADMTLADFWGVENVLGKENTTLHDRDLGTSLVMVSSRKGHEFFERVKPRLNYVQVTPAQAMAGNPMLMASLPAPLVDRGQFFRDLDVMTFTQVADKYIADKSDDTKKHRSEIWMLRRVYGSLKGLWRTYREWLLSPSALFKLLRCNSLVAIRQRNVFAPLRHTVVRFDKGAKLSFRGFTRFGVKKFAGSKLESRILVEKDGMLRIEGGVGIAYGADIEVFSGGKLTFLGGGGMNIGLTIICAERVDIGKDVMMGRNVTIRDNNGGHYINRPGYRNTRPVIIGDKAWLCEGCTIMPGVKVGDGAIVGAHAFVTQNVPAHSMVSGNPAVVVDRDVLWKY